MTLPEICDVIADVLENEHDLLVWVAPDSSGLIVKPEEGHSVSIRLEPSRIDPSDLYHSPPENK